MHDNWIPLQAALNEGSEHILDNQSIWEEPIKEFKIAAKITSPLKAVFSLFPQEEGLLVRGVLSGEVTIPCNRCACETAYKIEHSFDSFEPYLTDEESLKEETEVDEYFMRLSPLGLGQEINFEALAWEEFVQALPMHPLCNENCAGLCKQCGTNLNEGTCDCAQEYFDPRLAPLRGLKITKK